MHGSPRPKTARALFAVAAVAIALATVAGYAWRAVGTSDQAADRAARAVQDADVRAMLGERAADALIAARPDLISGRWLIASTIGAALDSDAFAAVLRAAVRDAHAAVFARDQDTLTLTLADVGVVAAAGLRAVAPDLAERLERSPRVTVLREQSDRAGAAAETARRLRTIALVAAAIAVLAAAGAAVARGDPRAAAAGLGATLVAAGVVVVALQLAAGEVVTRLPATDDGRSAARALWNAFFGDLRALGWLLAATGAIAVAVATTRVPTVAVERPLRRLWHAVATEPRSGAARVARGAGLLALGAAVFAAPGSAAALALRGAALYIGYKGLEAVLRAVAPAPAAAAPARPRRRVRRLLVPALAAVVALGLASALLRPDRAVTGPASEPVGCNGHVELCDRTLPDTALAATHNSMSVPLPGWSAALHEHPIDRQLEDGIRGLLIDTHYGERLRDGRVRTVFGSPADLTASLRDDPVGSAGLAAADRLRERLGFRGEGERGLYLCHTFCELGATPLADVLEDIRAFLVMHPADVLVIVNQDHVTPEDLVGAVRRAGLARLVFTPPAPGSPWPTLGEMIERDRRLMIVAENEAGAAPWYQLAYDRLVEETPYSFGAPAELLDADRLAAGCRAERGPEGAPLFLLNHWINTDPTPRPSNAERVNTRDALLARAAACEGVRGRTPNLVAVDFYGRGDVFGTVDELNGLDAGSS